jgi:hypothetical protein
MEKFNIIVPRGIRYIGEWRNFRFNNFPSKCIINKQLPGCGFTEYCIGGPENVILCSPRKMLLKNKKDQHEFDVYLVVNEMDKESNIDKDLSKVDKNTNLDAEELDKKFMDNNSEIYKRLYREIEEYCISRSINGLPCKILVTYDSYRIVKDILEKLDRFYTFYTVVDEFQSILHDSRFKSDIELKFLEYLKQSPRRREIEFTNLKNEVIEIIKYLFLMKTEYLDYLENLITTLGDKFCVSSVLDYIKTDPLVNKDLYSKYLEIVKSRETGIYSNDDIVNQEVSEFLGIYTGLTTIYDKLKLLCEYGLSQDSINIVLGQISDSDEIKSYYLSITPSRLRALGYNVTRIKRELNIVTFSQELLEKSMYLEFKVGDRLSLSDIKLN